MTSTGKTIIIQYESLVGDDDNARKQAARLFDSLHGAMKEAQNPTVREN